VRQKFDQESIAMAQAFADQAALAFHNARLYDDSIRRRRVAEHLADVAKMLTQSHNVEDLAAQLVGRWIQDGHAVDVYCPFPNRPEGTVRRGWCRYAANSPVPARRRHARRLRRPRKESSNGPAHSTPEADSS